MAAFADDLRSDTREQFGDRAALEVLVGKLKIVARSREMGFPRPRRFGSLYGPAVRPGQDTT
jgi:hypothetical protein